MAVISCATVHHLAPDMRLFRATLRWLPAEHGTHLDANDAGASTSTGSAADEAADRRHVEIRSAANRCRA
jgi:hypothetical protein